METRAILFDLDGTLIDTTNLILRCFDHSWETVCGQSHSREALIETFGIPLREAMKILATRSGGIEILSEREEGSDLIERLLSEYRQFNAANHDSMARPFDKTQQVIAELRARGYSTAVVTSKGRELATRGLNLCSLYEMMDAAVFLEDTDRHKPDPEPILTALDKLNLSAESAVYVGDSRHDIIAGRRAGVRTVAALWGPFPRAGLEGERPDYLAESITELLNIFE